RRPGVSHFDEETIAALLNDTLQMPQLRDAEQHLAECSVCQSRLESAAGDQQQWNDSKVALAADVVATMPAVPRPRKSTGSHRTKRDLPDETKRGIDVSPEGGVFANDAADVAFDSQEQTVAAPQRLGRYDVYGVIGRGGMGVVYHGWDASLNRPVAIKQLSQHLATLPSARRRFTREARASATMVHPSIVPIYEVSAGNEKETAFLVMPLIGESDSANSDPLSDAQSPDSRFTRTARTENLQQRIDRVGAMPVSEAIDIARQVAEGLAEAHSRGVVHRDIKPGNLLLQPGTQRIFITDFGLARAVDDATMTVSGTVGGTPQFMSPEQSAGRDVGPSSDLFSLGVVLYVMLTGEVPFNASTPIAVLRKIIDEAHVPATKIDPTLPEWVDTLLDRFLCKSPSDRLSDANAAADLLQRLQQHVRNPSAFPLPESLNRKRDSPRGARTVAVIAITAACLISLMVGSAAALWQAGGQNDSDNQSNDMTNARGLVDQNPQVINPSSVASNIGQGNKPMSPRDYDHDIRTTSWDWYGFESEMQSLQREMQILESQSEIEHYVPQTTVDQ
ncbi:MAG: serine/threonine-protein kinase, partial [Planctomycetota bacterium]